MLAGWFQPRPQAVAPNSSMFDLFEELQRVEALPLQIRVDLAFLIGQCDSEPFESVPFSKWKL
jgi:hypothetical protein